MRYWSYNQHANPYIYIDCFITIVIDESLEQEWPHSSYPPWAHGPGYVISQDIARFVVEGHEKLDLMVRTLLIYLSGI